MNILKSSWESASLLCFLSKHNFLKQHVGLYNHICNSTRLRALTFLNVTNFHIEIWYICTHVKSDVLLITIKEYFKNLSLVWERKKSPLSFIYLFISLHPIHRHMEDTQTPSPRLPRPHLPPRSPPAPPPPPPPTLANFYSSVRTQLKPLLLIWLQVGFCAFLSQFPTIPKLFFYSLPLTSSLRDCIFCLSPQLLSECLAQQKKCLLKPSKWMNNSSLWAS